MEIKFEKNRKSPWFIDYRAGGFRKREFFKTKLEAKKRADAIERQRLQFGTKSLIYSAAEQADFAEARRLLDAAGLRERVSVFVARCLLKPENKIAVQSVMAGYEEYLESKIRLGRSKQTIGDIRSDIKRFCVVHKDKLLSDLTRADVEKYIVSNHKWSPRTCRNQLTAITSFLNWCASRNWLSFEPKFNRDAILPRELKKPVGVFSVDYIDGFFKFLESTRYKKYASFFAVQAFCGIRRAEAERAYYFKIDYDAKTITLPAEITKTGDEWTLRNLPENVWAWLEKYPIIVRPWEDTLTRLRAAWGREWVHNGLRHTFATMHVGLLGKVSNTQLILRHRDINRIWQNYLANPVSKDEARRYFSIVPAED